MDAGPDRKARFVQPVSYSSKKPYSRRAASWQTNSGIGLASSLEFFLGVPRAVKHAQHHKRPPDDEIENTVRKVAQVHTPDILEANGIEERFIAQPPEQALCFRLQTQSDAELLPFIPG